MKPEQLSELVEKHTKDGVLDAEAFNSELSKKQNEAINAIILKKTSKIENDFESKMEQLKAELSKKDEDAEKDNDEKVDINAVVEKALEKQRQEFETKLNDQQKLETIKKLAIDKGIDPTKIDHFVKLVDIKDLDVDNIEAKVDELSFLKKNDEIPGSSPDGGSFPKSAETFEDEVVELMGGLDD